MGVWWVWMFKKIWDGFWIKILKIIYKHRMKYGYRTPRQPYNCYIILDVDLKEIIFILKNKGFDINENHPLQFIDTGQVIGARKIINKEEQVHVRMYNGVEGYSVHAHVEFIPEKAPLRHILGWGSKNGCDCFFYLWNEKQEDYV